jgi:CheY-like chemotaxis protein
VSHLPVDLSDYYVIYQRDVDTHFAALRQHVQGLETTPDDRSLIAAAARAAHSIKGVSWTMRDTPMLLNGEPPDPRFDGIAGAAEQLEMQLEAVLQGQRPLDWALLRDGLGRLEAEIQQQSASQSEGISPRKDSSMSGSILIVDDEELFRKLMLSYFARIGLDATAVRSAAEALEHLRSDPAAVDLILLDIAMPDQNGFDFARIVRADPELAAIPIIAVTARKGIDVNEEAKEAGIDRLITKPPEPNAIRDVCVELGLIAAPDA